MSQPKTYRYQVQILPAKNQDFKVSHPWVLFDVKPTPDGQLVVILETVVAWV